MEKEDVKSRDEESDEFREIHDARFAAWAVRRGPIHAGDWPAATPPLSALRDRSPQHAARINPGPDYQSCPVFPACRHQQPGIAARGDSRAPGLTAGPATMRIESALLNPSKSTLHS